MIGTLLPRLDLAAILVEGLGTFVRRNDHIAILAVDNHPDLSTPKLGHALVPAGILVLLGLGQSPNLEDQGRLLVLMIDELGIGRVAIVLIAGTSAHAEHLRAQRGGAQGPAGDVHLVDTLIAQIAVTGDELPVPIVMELGAHQGLQRRRTAPQIIVDVIGHLGRHRHVPDALARLVAQASCHLDGPQITRVEPGNCLAKARV